MSTFILGFKHVFDGPLLVSEYLYVVVLLLLLVAKYQDDFLINRPSFDFHSVP